MTARQVAEQIGAHIGAPERSTTVDGFLAGDPDLPVRGVAVTVMATLEVLREAARRGLDLVITHEALYFDHHGTSEATLAAEGDPVLAAKQAFVAEHGLCVLRAHDAWHDREPDGVLTGAARALGWLDAARPADIEVFDVPPTTLGDLAVHVARSLGARAARYVGDPAAAVRTVAVQPGFQGFEWNRRMLARPDVDALVIGEGHEWETGEHAADAAAAGLCAGVVVVGHAPSEEAGMAEYARWLADLLPDVPVEHIVAEDHYRPVVVP